MKKDVSPLKSVQISDDRIAVVMLDIDEFIINKGTTQLVGSRDNILNKFGEAYSRGTAVDQAKAIDDFTEWPNQGVVVSSGITGFKVGDLLYLRINSGTVIKAEGRIIRVINKLDVIAKKDK